jgi:hypothetical protein
VPETEISGCSETEVPSGILLETTEQKVCLQEYKSFNQAGCNFKLKSSEKQPVTDSKMSEHRAAFVQSKKIPLSDKHTTIDDAQNYAKSFRVYELQIFCFFGIYQSKINNVPYAL